MDGEMRERLARIETLNTEQNKKLDTVLTIGEAVARMGEGNINRDAQLKIVFEKLEKQEQRTQSLINAKFWGAGVIAVFVAIILPVIGAVLYGGYVTLNSLSQRVQQVEDKIIYSVDKK